MRLVAATAEPCDVHDRRSRRNRRAGRRPGARRDADGADGRPRADRQRAGARRRHHAADRQRPSGAAVRGRAARDRHRQGRHHYHRLASPAVAHMLETHHGASRTDSAPAAAPRGRHRPARRGDAGGAHLLRPSRRAARGAARRLRSCERGHVELSPTRAARSPSPASHSSDDFGRRPARRRRPAGACSAARASIGASGGCISAAPSARRSRRAASRSTGSAAIDEFARGRGDAGRRARLPRDLRHVDRWRPPRAASRPALNRTLNWEPSTSRKRVGCAAAECRPNCRDCRAWTQRFPVPPCRRRLGRAGPERGGRGSGCTFRRTARLPANRPISATCRNFRPAPSSVRTSPCRREETHPLAYKLIRVLDRQRQGGRRLGPAACRPRRCAGACAR